jgi:hypothetical protein
MKLNWRQLLGIAPAKPILEAPKSYISLEENYEGFIKTMYGSLYEANLTVYPNKNVVVQWCSKTFQVDNYDSKKPVQSLVSNPNGMVEFLVTKKI